MDYVLNSPWLFAAAALAAATVATMVLDLIKGALRGRITRLLSRTRTSLDDFAGYVADRTGFFLVLWLVLWAALSLEVPEEWRRTIRLAGILSLFAQVAVWGNAAISFMIRHYTARASAHAVAATAVTALAFVARLSLVALLLLVALMNAGINVSALLAGLGIGGVAVALAVQSVLKDLLGAVSIIVGKPFLVGDLIEVGDYMGTVKEVQMRFTRLENLPGEEVTMPNSCLLDSFVRNHSRMTERRVSEVLTLAYGMSAKQAKEVPDVIRESIEQVQGTRFARAHLKRFGTWGIEYEFVYYVLHADYDVYMERQQQVNQRMMQRLEDMGIPLGPPALASALASAT